MAQATEPVREHLRRIVATERDVTLKWVARARVGGVSLYALQNVAYVLAGYPEARAAHPVLFLYAGVAGVVALLTELSPRLRVFSGFGLGLIDIPLITLAAAVAVPVTTEPHALLTSTLPFAGVLIACSALTLSYRMVAGTTLSASLCSFALMRSMGDGVSDMLDPMMALWMSGGVAALVIFKLQALVQESRRKDVAGRYLLGKRLGVGGMAEVFVAIYSPEGGFERRVALKRVLPALAANAEFLALFRREAELGALLAHPNLVQVLDFGRHLDSWFIAMELVEGLSLSELIHSNSPDKPLPLHVGLFIIAEVAEGLCYLHEKRSGDGQQVGLVHRDVNAPNVLISIAGEVKVSDFGIARWATSSGLTRAGVVRGKVSSMAPEVLKGEAPTPAADLFSLGVLAYELLTGTRLFRGRADTDIVRAVLDLAVTAPSTTRAEIPPELDQLVLALLNRDPARRPSARLVSGQLRGLEGPHAPYPRGRQALVDALAGTKVHLTGWEPPS